MSKPAVPGSGVAVEVAEHGAEGWMGRLFGYFCSAFKHHDKVRPEENLQMEAAEMSLNTIINGKVSPKIIIYN